MPDWNATVASLVGGGVVIAGLRLALTAAARALERRKNDAPAFRRHNDMMDDYEHLVAALQHQIDLLHAEMERMAARVSTLENSEARLMVELRTARETAKMQIERVYADLEASRQRIDQLERENNRLRMLMGSAEGQE